MSRKSRKDIYIETDRALEDFIKEHGKSIDDEFMIVLEALKRKIAEEFEKFGANGILTREEMTKYGRWSLLEQYIITEIQNLNTRQVQLTKDSIRDIFEESYYRYGYMIESEVELSIYEILNQAQIDSGIKNENTPIEWEDRVRKNNEEFMFFVIQDIYESLATGSSYADIVKDVSERFTKGANKGINLLWIEAKRVQEKANFESMEKANETLKYQGIQVRKQWLSAKDSRVRHTHRHLDGQTVDLDEMFTSSSGAKALAPRQFGVPSEDINCRCTLINVFFDENGKRIGGKAMRARNHGDRRMGTIVPYQKYTDWIKRFRRRR